MNLDTESATTRELALVAPVGRGFAFGRVPPLHVAQQIAFAFKRHRALRTPVLPLVRVHIHVLLHHVLVRKYFIAQRTFVSFVLDSHVLRQSLFVLTFRAALCTRVRQHLAAARFFFPLFTQSNRRRRRLLTLLSHNTTKM